MSLGIWQIWKATPGSMVSKRDRMKQKSQCVVMGGRLPLRALGSILQEWWRTCLGGEGTGNLVSTSVPHWLRAALRGTKPPALLGFS